MWLDRNFEDLVGGAIDRQDWRTAINWLLMLAPILHTWFDTHHCSIMGNRMRAQRFANVWMRLGMCWEDVVVREGPMFRNPKELVSLERRFKGLGLLK